MSEARITLFVGMPGTGKTQAMMDFVREQSSTHRFLVPDRAGEWGEHHPEAPGQPNPRWRGKPPPLVHVPLEIAGDPDAAFAWFEEQPPAGVFLFGHPWEGLDVAAVCTAIGNCVYADDEIDLVAQLGGWKDNPLREVVHRGRHLPNAQGEVCKVAILGACRRPANLHPDLSAMAEQAFIYRVQGKLTLNRLREDSWIEDEEWETVRTLPNLHFRHWPSGAYLEAADAFSQKGKPPGN